MKYLSNSEMKEWRSCKRAWWLGYYRGLRKRDRRDYGKPTGIGNLVHEALDGYYGHGRDPLAHIAAFRAEALERDPAFAADIEKQHDLVEAMLSGYLDWLAETGADQALRVTGSERAMTAPLMEGVELVSKIDVTIEHEEHGSDLAMDHKTVGSLTQAIPLLQQDTQMLTEHLVQYIAAPEAERARRVRGVLYNMLLKSKRTARAKGPFYQREPVRHNEHELRNHWRHVLRTAVEIADAERLLAAGYGHHDVVPPHPTRDCTWRCPFYRVCRLADDGSDFEAALAAHYEPGDPLERYQGLLPDLPRTPRGEG